PNPRRQHYRGRSWRMEAVRACDEANESPASPVERPHLPAPAAWRFEKARRPPRRSATRSTGKQHRTGLAGLTFVAAALFEQTPSAKPSQSRSALDSKRDL